MSGLRRVDIRRMKRAVSAQGDAKAMLYLLERSVRFGHKKLALLRCLQAERLGIPVAEELLAYCRAVADSLPEDALHAVLRQAAAAHGSVH